MAWDSQQWAGPSRCHEGLDLRLVNRADHHAGRIRGKGMPRPPVGQNEIVVLVKEQRTRGANVLESCALRGQAAFPRVGVHTSCPGGAQALRYEVCRRSRRYCGRRPWPGDGRSSVVARSRRRSCSSPGSPACSACYAHAQHRCVEGVRRHGVVTGAPDDARNTCRSSQLPIRAAHRGE